MTKINTFYSEKLAEATRKIAALKSELTRQHELASGKGRRETPGGGFLNTLQAGRSKRSAAAQNPTIRKLQDVKLAFSEYYLSLVLLQNYQSLNYTGKLKLLVIYYIQIRATTRASKSLLPPNDISYLNFAFSHLNFAEYLSV